MSILRIHQSICIVSLVCIFSYLAEAKDLSALQSALTFARENMIKAKTEHEANAQAFTKQQKIVEERRKQLADESKQLDKAQEDTKQSWERYQQAKHEYEKIQSTFDKTWSAK